MSMFFHTSGVRARTDFGGVIFVWKKKKRAKRNMEGGVLGDDVARIVYVSPYVENAR